MLKPSELKKKSFTRAVRGYSVAEVDEYMSFMLEKYTELFRRNFELEQQLRAAIEQNTELESEKESIRSNIVNAQKVAATIIEKANARADAIIESAKVGGNSVLSDLNEQINAERDTVIALKNQVSSLKRSLYETYREHIERVESLTKITDSAKIKSSEDYLLEAARRAKAALKNLKPEEKPQVNINYDFSDTAETEVIKDDVNVVDENTLLDNADTVVFEKVEDTTGKTDVSSGDTLVIDRIKDDNE
ncbi:MAG: DivIVA domain-containing protein [Ruminococcaceae bacterium]|nr:DivIVA domain-containing protein [Oscillospiraceae bacterium]